MKTEGTKFKFLRDLKDKAKSPNAIKLLKDIERMLEQGNESRADALLSRYKRRYAKEVNSFSKVSEYLGKLNKK